MRCRRIADLLTGSLDAKLLAAQASLAGTRARVADNGVGLSDYIQRSISNSAGRGDREHLDYKGADANAKTVV